MKILLTGAGGFIGSNLTKFILTKLSTTDKIYVMSSSLSHSQDNITYIHTPNNKISEFTFAASNLQNIDILIHLASYMPKSSADHLEIDKNITSIQYTSKLLHYLPCTPTKILFASTIDVYKKTNEKITEESEVGPISLYASSKFFLESYLETWCQVYKSSLQILRIGHIYGPQEDKSKKLIPHTIKSVLYDQKPEIYSNGKELRSYLFIDDCCKAIWMAALKKNSNSPINIASSRSYSVLEVVKQICDISGKSIQPLVQAHDIETQDVIFDNKKMIKLLCEEEVSLFSGLTKTWNYYKDKMHENLL